MAPERERYIYKGSVRDQDNPLVDNSPSWPSTGTSKRIKGVRAGVAAIATLFVLQTGALINRTSRVEGKAVRASIETVYHSRAQQVAPEAEPPLTTATTISPRREVRPAPPKREAPPAAKPKPAESPKCSDGWDLLSENVCLTEFREHGSDVYVVRADLKDPKVSVHPSYVAGPGRLGRLSDVAERLDAKAAINASFIINKAPVGPIAALGGWLSQDTSPQQVMIVNNDNTVEVLPTEHALMKNPAQMKFALSGSHVLVQNGIAKDNFGPDNPGCILNCDQPRSAIGVDAGGQVYMAVVDGRRRNSPGATMPELAEIMRGVGVDYAIALDGGGSAQLYANGEIRNNPSNGSRPISTAVVVTANR